MASVSNFLLNGFVAVAELFTQEPDVEQVHNVVDTLARSNQSSGHNNTQSTANTSSNNALARSNQSSGHNNNTQSTANTSSATDTSNNPTTTTTTNTSSNKSTARLPFWKKFARSPSTTMATGATETCSNNSQDAHNNDDDQFFDANEHGEDLICNPDDIFYPNGSRTITLDKGETIGWALLPVGHRVRKDGTKVRYKKCLGAFYCPHPNCKFTSRPQVPKGRSRKCESERGTETMCKDHKLPLMHKKCKASVTIFDNPQSQCVVIKHEGNHDHPKPHRIHISNHGKQIIRNHMKSEPGVTPISLQVGATGREPVWKEDPVLINIGRLRATVSKERKTNHSTIDIAAFDKKTEGSFITQSSLSSKDGCIIMQTPTMRKILKESEVSSETDTIEGFLYDNVLPDANLTVTSSYCSLLDKWVPTQMAILFGKSAEHYKIFFQTLLEKGFEYKDFNEFDNNFMGMVCDFSDGERDGFEMAIMAAFSVCGDDFNVGKFYTYCLVHFDRSVNRICRNNAVVSVQRKQDFQDQVSGLRNETDTETFWHCVDRLKHQFPKCTKWIDWYLNPKRAKIFFPSLKDEGFVGNVQNTNAQESTGRTIQLAYSTDKATSVADVFFHLFRYATNCDATYNCRAKGHPVDYTRPKSPPRRSRTNDGRPPDSNKTLFGKVKQKTGNTPGRKRGVENLVPSGNAVVPFDICIPWNFNYTTEEGTLLNVVNTCAMDTVLMGFYLLRQHDSDLRLKIKGIVVLDAVLDKIDNKNFDEARIDWIQHCTSLDQSYLAEPMISSSTNHSGEQVTKWNCKSSCASQFEGKACKELFLFKFFDSYSLCSMTREGGQCGYYDLYSHDGHAERIQRAYHISLHNRSLGKIQAEVLDAIYGNDGSDGVEVPCGNGTRNKPKELEDGTYIPNPDCDGFRFVERRIIQGEGEGPTILFFERGIMEWEIDVPRSSTVTCMNKLEPQLVIGNQRYILVYCMLGNGGHFQGIAVIYGKYLYYDGMKAQKMKWISADTQFDNGYSVNGLWYKFDGYTDEPTDDSETADESATAKPITTTVNMNDDKDTTIQSTAKQATTSKSKATTSTKPTPSKATASKTTNFTLQPPIQSKKRPPLDEMKLMEGTAIAAANKGRQISVVKKARGSYPTGISVACVSRRGKQPSCQYCRDFISREEWHTVKKTNSQGQHKEWKITSHYHFQCYELLSEAERRQLVLLIQKDRLMDIDLLGELEASMGRSGSS